jgi:hypothetical protein
LDAIRVEVLELQPIREQHPTDEPVGGVREAVLVEGHERHHIPLGAHSSLGTLHSTASMSGRSWPASTRRRSCSRETLERVQFDIATTISWTGWKHKQWHGCERRRSQSAEGECERKKEKMGRQSPKSAHDVWF